jgi:hypothetical protein
MRASINRASKKKIKLSRNIVRIFRTKSDSNFSDILTLRTFIKLKRSKKSKRRFSTDFFKKDSWQPYERQKVKTVTCIAF